MSGTRGGRSRSSASGSRGRKAAASRGPRARKSLGQHFLRDSGILRDIAAAVGPPLHPVIEIGAGTGQLTEALLDDGHQIVAIEIESRLVRHLKQRFVKNPRLEVVEGDVRDIELSSLVEADANYIMAGNLPYFAASYITRKAIESAHPPEEAIVMVQREVAREMAARPGKLSLLALGIQVYAEPTMLFDVSPEAFEPPPAVWSSVVRLRIRTEPKVCPLEAAGFFEFVSRVFRNPRKQIHNALRMTGQSAKQALQLADIDPTRRPETLEIDEWLRLKSACSDIVTDE